MIAKLPHATVRTCRMADAAQRAARTIAAVLSAVAAWIAGKLRWQDAIIAILAALLGIAARNATARPRDARSWEQNGDYDFA